MDTSPNARLQSQSIWIRILSLVGRVLLAVAIPLIAFYVLYVGFIFLRDSDAPRERDRSWWRSSGASAGSGSCSGYSMASWRGSRMP